LIGVSTVVISVLDLIGENNADNELEREGCPIVIALLYQNNDMLENFTQETKRVLTTRARQKPL
jgi:hypothetical protein